MAFLDISNNTFNEGLNMKTLKLVLKKKWYEMIASGEKTEEYRDVTDYWNKRISGKGYQYVTFFLGYAKDRPSMTFEMRTPKISKGIPQWGAEIGKDYWVLRLGKRIS